MSRHGRALGEGPAVLPYRWLRLRLPRSASGAAGAAIPAVTGHGLKPLTTSQRPSDSSQAATGSAASAVQGEPCAMPPNNVVNTAAMSRGAPMSPITGMTRGTRRDRYIREPSSSALMPGMRLCPSRNVQL